MSIYFGEYKMTFETIFTVLAAGALGGIAGPLLSTIWGNNLTSKREYNNWLIQERHKLFSQLLTIVTYTPKDEQSLNEWTYQIRDISQKIHILFKGGCAPKKLNNSIEAVFRMAQELKDADNFDKKNWNGIMRDSIRDMREAMSSNIQTK